MSSSESDARFAGNMTFLALFGPLAVMVMLMVRFFLNPLAVALFCVVHYVVLYLIGSAMTQSVGGFIGFLFALWAYSYFLLGSFNTFMGPFEGLENGILVWAIKNLGVGGQIYYFVQRGFVLIVFGTGALVGLATGAQTGDAAFATLAVLIAIQSIVFWVYHTRHPIGVFLDFWGRPRPELMEGYGSPDEAFEGLSNISNRPQGGQAAARTASGTSSMGPVTAETLPDFADAVPLILLGRGGKRREARQASDGRVLLETVTGPKVFETEDQARAYIS